MKPNIVLVVLDTARASAFEPWGAPAGSTPTVAQLASSGLAVDHAVSTSNWTLPSHAAMFTGGLPRAVGLADLPSGRPHAVRSVLEASHTRLLPEVLRRAGYRTHGASANAWISTAHGFDTGFDTWVDVRGHRDTGITDHSLKARLRWMYQALKADIDDGADAALAAAQSWIADGSAQTQPFFWFFNLIECHSPYLPPRPWNDLGPLDRVRAGREARRHLSIDAIWRSSAARDPAPAGAVGRMRHLYGRAVTLMDAWLGRLLTLLADHGVLDDTWVVVTSDHGENLGEGGLLGHAFSLDERLLRVPLVISGPDSVDVPDFFSTVGLAAVIGRMAGLAANPWARDRSAPTDVAIAQYEAIVPPDDPRLDTVTHEWNLDTAGRDMFSQPMTAATDGRRKLVRHGAAFVSYDLDADPGERSPVAVADPSSSVVRDLYDAMVAADALDMDPAVLAHLAEGADGSVDEDLAAQLRLLGYL